MLSVIALLALVQTAPAAAPSRSTALTAEIRTTSYGVPHVRAAGFAGVAFGLGYAFAKADLCTVADRWVTAGLTDLMPRIFATGLAPVEHACGLALLGLDIAAPLRAPLARHLLQGLRV